MKTLTFVRPPFEGMGNYKPPHLGIATLYSYLKKQFPNIKFNYIDALAYHYSEKEVLKKIFDLKPDFIAFTVKTMQYEQTKTLICEIHKVYKPIIICGGNHISVDPNTIIYDGADYAIIGEGEKAFERIIKYELHMSNISIQNFCNIITKNNVGKIKPSPLIELKENEMVAPDWSIMDIENYNENIHLNKAIPALPIMASRGCPYKCDFCSTHLTWTTQVRYRSPKDILDEIKLEKNKYNINDFHFYDDNLMLNRKWLIEFLDLIKEDSVKFNWICLSRPDIIIKNKDLLPIMKKCGCKGLELGFETENDGLYLKMNKKNTKTIFKKTYDLLCREGFEMIEFLLMCFYEGETLYSLYETYRQLEKYKKQKALFVSSRYFATPFQGTQYYEKVKNKGYDISISNKYKYAIFLNFMPLSFLDSSLNDFLINPIALELQLRFLNIENLIYLKEFGIIMDNIRPILFAEKFNEFAKNRKKINDLCLKIQELIPIKMGLYPIYEYMGRMIEFAISRGVVSYKEDTFLQ